MHSWQWARRVLRPGEIQNKIYSRALLAADDGFDYDGAVDDAAVSPGSSTTPEATLVVNTRVRRGSSKLGCPPRS